MKQRRRSDTERAILRALMDVPEPEWCWRYLDHSRSLGSRTDRAYVRMFPDRRNRPTHRNIERALDALVSAGEVERKESTAHVGERLHRLTPLGRQVAASLND